MSATATTRRPTTGRQRSRNRGLPFDEFLVLAALALLLCAVLLPLLVVALPLALVWLAGTRRGWWPAWLPVLVGVVVGGAWALWLRAHGGWAAALDGYLTAQQDALVLLVERWGTLTPLDALPYLGAVWPYAVPGGMALGGALAFGVWFGVRLREASPNDRTPFTPVGADEHARLEVAPSAVCVEQFLGKRRVTVLASWPKQGKSFAVGGMLAAGARGGTWFGRAVHRMRTFWLTEESREGFKETVEAFALTSADVRAVHFQEIDGQGWFGEENWTALVDYACRMARRAGADVLAIDSLFTWASWYQRSPDKASFCFRVLRRAAERYDLAVLVIAHNTKGGSADAPVLALLGTIAASAMVDQVASFQREKATGACTLIVEGRKLDGKDGEWTCTAILQNGTYVPIGTTPPRPEPRSDDNPAPTLVPPPRRPSKPLPRALAETLRELGRAPATAAHLQQTLGITKSTASERLTRLVQMGLVQKAKNAEGLQEWSIVTPTPEPRGHDCP